MTEGRATETRNTDTTLLYSGVGGSCISGGGADRPANADALEGVQAGGRAGLVPFIYGFPDPTMFPVADLIACAEEALRERAELALQYGPEQGYGPLLDYLLEKLRRDEGLQVGRENIILTAGATQGLDLACRLFTRPGDIVLVEGPSYHEAMMIFRDYPVRLVQVPLDGEGLIVEALAKRLQALHRAGEHPRLLYTIPNFQNPSGVTLAAKRRPAIVALAREQGMLILEDDVYRDLCYEGGVPPSLYALDDSGVVIRTGSFSKILAAGLRLGWVLAAPEVITRLAASGFKAAGGGATPFISHLVTSYCQRGLLEPHIAALVEHYRAKRDVMLAALARWCPQGVSWTVPRGGFFVWLTLPPSLEARAVLAEAERRGVTFLSGEVFFAEECPGQYIRLPFSYLPPAQIEEGVRVVGEAMNV